ncbi:TSUP family transporter [uncultured Deinococcus sp.]|uniref:TSUP family transporter n=2 Tax=uncultured Deinococcus sp. TaxID=158789 RepID=UPI00258AD586|nr:TSUP family transporter [uncultured Deinococcus sp.]
MPGPEVLLYGLPLAFLAGFIDAVAGGGGTITLPTLLLMGLNPAQVVATNKLLAIFGSGSATVQYWRKGHVEKALVLRLVPLALLGSALGAYLVHFVSPAAFQTLVGVVILGVGVLVLANKRFGLEDRYPGLTARTLALTLPGALIIGMYDGFLGPGTGTFLMFLFALAGFNLVRSSGNARTINFATNLGAFLFFLTSGQMVWWIGLPMGVANALGAMLGARMAMLRGSAFVKWMYGGIILLVAARLFFLR